MPSYTVPLEGGGQMTVNASSQAAANDNVRQQGGTPSSSASAFIDTTRSGGGTDYAPSGGGGGGGGGDMANLTASQMILTNAKDKAYQAYLNSRLQLDNDTLAFQKATEAFNETISTAQQTGMFQGAPTQQALQTWGQMYGTYGQPTAGQQTLANQLQTAQQLGTYQGQQTLAANQQQFNQWAQAQQLAQTQWQQQQQAAQSYLQMMAGLRGPADWAKYQQVLGSTPQGMQDLVRAAAGQYVPGGGATTGVAPTPVSLSSFVNSATGQPPSVQGGAPTTPGGTQDNAQSTMNALVAPNQMAPQTWNNLTPSQKQMLLGTWESQGYDKNDAEALFSQQLPKYATQATGAGTFKLQ